MERKREQVKQNEQEVRKETQQTEYVSKVGATRKIDANKVDR